MSNSKLTLIIDGNWLLMSRLSVINDKYESDDDLFNALQKMLLRSIEITIKHFKDIDNIIFVADGGSWRNKVELPKCLESEGIEYKGNRIKSDDINWDKVFYKYEELINILKSTNINVCKESGIEGDDWCYYWSNKLNSENTNCIIWSKDRDLTQLVKINSDFCFTTCWDKKSGFVLPEYNYDDFNFLFNAKYNENYQIFNNIITNNKNNKINYIKPNAIVVEKILKGDAVDNIQPVFVRNSKSNSEKKFKISTKDIDTSLNVYDDNEVLKFFENVLNSKSYLNRVDKNIDDIIEHFKYNRTLISLNEKSYPKNILDIMNSKNIEKINKNISEALNIVISKSNKLSNILEFI